MGRCSGKEIHEWQGDIIASAFSSDCRFVLIGNNDNWPCRAGLEHCQRRRRPSFEGHSQTISSVAFSPDDQFVLTGSFDKTARLWDRQMVGKSVVSKVTRRSTQWHFPRMVDSFQLATRTRQRGCGTPLLVKRSVGLRATRLLSFQWPFTHGRFVLTGGLDKTARLWNLATGHEIRRFDSPSVSVSVWSIAFSPDGRYAIAQLFIRWKYGFWFKR